MLSCLNEALIPCRKELTLSTTLLTAGALPSRAGVAGTSVDVSVDVGVCVGTDVGPSFGVQLFPLPRLRATTILGYTFIADIGAEPDAVLAVCVAGLAVYLG